MNSSWAKEQNVLSCYQLNDLGLPWWQFESLYWGKSPLRPSRNFWKVAQMKYIIILSGHNKFEEIRPENMALELVWSCQQDDCLSDLTGFLAYISLLEGRMGTDIRRTLTLLMCADCSTFLCIFRQFLAFFGTIFTFRLSFASGANGEVACHSQEHLKSCDLHHLSLEQCFCSNNLACNIRKCHYLQQFWWKNNIFDIFPTQFEYGDCV